MRRGFQQEQQKPRKTTGIVGREGEVINTLGQAEERELN